jgi:hypothetical protein
MARKIQVMLQGSADVLLATKCLDGRIENETVWWKLVVGGHSRRRRRRNRWWWWWCWWWWCWWCWWELDYDTGYMTEITWFSNKHSSLQLMGVGSQLWLHAWAAWAATIQAWMHLPAALGSLNVPNHLPKLPCDKHWKLLKIPTPSLPEFDASWQPNIEDIGKPIPQKSLCLLPKISRRVISTKSPHLWSV